MKTCQLTGQVRFSELRIGFLGWYGVCMRMFELIITSTAVRRRVQKLVSAGYIYISLRCSVLENHIDPRVFGE